MALGPLIDYGSHYEILHFVYDLVLWTTIGAKRATCPDMPMRLLMKGHPMFPEYWETLRDALMDMTRQCGYPLWYGTKSVYENAMTYHAFLEDQLTKMQ
eukprot:11370274-Karenia_brevis.AAC.1